MEWKVAWEWATCLVNWEDDLGQKLPNKTTRTKQDASFSHLAQVSSLVHHSCMTACASTNQKVTARERAAGFRTTSFSKTLKLQVALNDNLSQSETVLLPKAVVTLFPLLLAGCFPGLLGISTRTHGAVMQIRSGSSPTVTKKQLAICHIRQLLEKRW